MESSKVSSRCTRSLFRNDQAPPEISRNRWNSGARLDLDRLVAGLHAAGLHPKALTLTLSPRHFHRRAVALQYRDVIYLNFQPLGNEDSNKLPGFRNSLTVLREIWNFAWEYHPSAIVFSRSAVIVKKTDFAFCNSFIAKVERDEKGFET